MHPVKCVICGKKFDRDRVPCVQIGRRYAHSECALSEEEKKSKEQKDKEALEDYIKKLLNEDYINPRVRKSLKQYREEFKYTDSGMLKALIYFYEVKGNDKRKANGSIGIIPYVYKDAFNYYYALWQAQQKNESKVIETYVPQVKVIKIPSPKARIKKRTLFQFLDEEN